MGDVILGQMRRAAGERILWSGQMEHEHQIRLLVPPVAQPRGLAMTFFTLRPSAASGGDGSSTETRGADQGRRLPVAGTEGASHVLASHRGCYPASTPEGATQLLLQSSQRSGLGGEGGWPHSGPPQNAPGLSRIVERVHVAQPEVQPSPHESGNDSRRERALSNWVDSRAATSGERPDSHEFGGHTSSGDTSSGDTSSGDKFGGHHTQFCTSSGDTSSGDRVRGTP